VGRGRRAAAASHRRQGQRPPPRPGRLHRHGRHPYSLPLQAVVLTVSSTPVVDQALPTVSPLVPLRSVLLGSWHDGISICFYKNGSKTVVLRV